MQRHVTGNELISFPEWVNKSRDGAAYGRCFYQRGIKIETFMQFDNANNLLQGFFKAEKVSRWKYRTQKHRINLLREVCRMQQEIQGGTYKQSKGSEFKLCEQGHLRLVKALNVRDTAMQHSLVNTCLQPALVPHMIHDNGASLEGKGISFTRRRFEQHLRWHYQRYGREGYVLKIDFRKYFDNLDHAVIRRLFAEHVKDERALWTLDKILEANEVDVSYAPDGYQGRPFSSLEHEKVDKNLLTGRTMLKRSMGIGSVVSQIAGIYLPTRIDTWCKTVKGIHCYDVYMDDRIIIHPTKEFLHELLDEIKVIAKELGVFVHEKKTQIIKLSHGFTFLKTKYLLTETGKIIRRIPRDVVVRQRRKLKKLARFVASGEMSLPAFEEQYASWRGDKKRYNARRTLIQMDILFEELRTWIKKNTRLHSRMKLAA